MSLIIKNKLTGEVIEKETVLEETHYVAQGKKHILHDSNGTQLDLVLVINGCKVKYTPEKYDKFSVTLCSDNILFFNKWQESIKQDSKDHEGVNIQNIIKEGTISIKLSREQKADFSKNYKKDDNVDLVVGFNNIWEITGKRYVSLELVQIRKREEAEKEKILDYF